MAPPVLDPEDSRKMSAQASDVVPTLMSLPPEILEIILRKVFSDRCLHASMRRFPRLNIMLPKAILVSKAYFKVAKHAALQDSMIIVRDTCYFWSKDWLDETLDITVCTDFQTIQYLTILNMNQSTDKPYIEVLEAVLDAVPNLRRLVLGALNTVRLQRDDFICLRQEHFSYVPDDESCTDNLGNVAVALHSKGALAIKTSFMAHFLPDRYPWDPYGCFLAAAIETWLVQDVGVELCLEAEVGGEVGGEDPDPFWQPFCLWAARLNLRRNTLSIIPACENSRHVEGGEPESMMKMDPSFLLDSLKSPIAQGRLRAYKAEYRKD
ncbi:uncharacterized protein AB675_7269 [Cyphellophora attinorum]|uniref:F-box domain-containing protein n=1 Tax=Cyphellophora attinorum TaxID=1664694 RepID=A0A0N1H4P2_9EURO|nr:uncharacterized protein AB675_7269 [Phialophora attinorum]KPI36347.1 hypothetical protein AB675_7269 [Phialophora attinorum]